MFRTDIINYLIKKYNYKSYLEIGIGDGKNFTNIECQEKESVDPNPECFQILPTFKITSDEFFKKNTKTYDIIFVDGLHTFEQTYIDIKNSLNFLNKNGVVLAHDTLPPTEYHQRDPEFYKIGEEWNGTCWKAIAKLRTEENNISINTINTDWGVTIIKNGTNIRFIPEKNTNIDYEFYSQNKVKLMNVISVKEFMEL